jgi:hypothetical protein
MFLLAMPDFTSSEVWVSLLTLTFLEIVLGVDNIIFLSIISSKLPRRPATQGAAISALTLAMVLRIILLFGHHLDHRDESAPVSCRYPAGFARRRYGAGADPVSRRRFSCCTKPPRKFTTNSKAPTRAGRSQSGKRQSGAQRRNPIKIALINLVFSFDSILTAVGIADMTWWL